MNCTTCGANLPPGAAACPLCGTPAPYNAGRPGSSPQYDPTVAVPQAGPGGSPHQDPTLPAQPYGGTPPPPSTAYGSPGYGTPPPPPNPYETPSYNAPPQQQNYYGAPPQQQGGYVVPPPQQGGMYGTPQPPRRRSRLGLILGIIALVLIVACAGISFAVYQGVKQAGNTIATTTANETATSAANTTPTTSTNTTPTTSTSGNTGTSGTTIDPTAAGIITNTKMASAVDSNYNPTKVTDTFVTKQTIYATFKIDTNAPDGYVQGKWYADGKYAFSSKALAVKGDFLGYLSAEYNIATQGTVELYWCVQSDCSDGKLADVTNFTVTTSGIHQTQPPALAFMDINRP